ncbi:MAG: hypothetical protein ACYCW6_05670 [Candidatus Xenobia bacterium]
MAKKSEDKEKDKELDQPSVNLSLVADEIDRILSHVYGEYLVSGRPTKHGGLRFLDIHSAKTFGFERTRSTSKGNLLVISAPYTWEPEVIKEKLQNGVRAKELDKVDVRPSPDPGKEKKMFVEVSYKIPTGDILSEKNLVKDMQRYGYYNTSEVSKRRLREYVEPLAREAMNQLIEVIRELTTATPAS